MFSCSRATHINNQSHTSLDIVGGKPVSQEDRDRFPYIVALLGSTGNHVTCGGFLIDKSYILTAAHCKSPNIKRAIIGGYKKSRFDQEVSEKSAEVRNISSSDWIVHQEYATKKDSRFDIALIKLNVPSTKSKVYLVDNARTYSSLDSFHILGWGRTKSPQNPGDILQEVSVRYVEPSKCFKVHSSYNFARFRGFMVCTSSAHNKDACNGDSGSIVFLKGKHSLKEDRAVGVVSMGIGCAEGYPALNTNIQTFKSWLKEQTGLSFEIDPSEEHTPGPSEESEPTSEHCTRNRRRRCPK